MRHKKGTISFEVMMWVPRIIFLVFIMFSMVYIVRSYVTSNLETSELEAELFAFRLMHSNSSFVMVENVINRTYPYIVDMQKFQSGYLDKNIDYGSQNYEIGAKIIVKDSNNNEKTIFYNEIFFKEQAKIADSGFTSGPGGAKKYIKKYNVLISDNGKISKRTLTMEMVIPNS